MNKTNSKQQPINRKDGYDTLFAIGGPVAAWLFLAVCQISDYEPWLPTVAFLVMCVMLTYQGFSGRLALRHLPKRQAYKEVAHITLWCAMLFGVLLHYHKLTVGYGLFVGLGAMVLLWYSAYRYSQYTNWR